MSESRQLASERALLCYDEYQEKVQTYRSEWKKYESTIIPSLTESIGVTFYKSVIDVHCAPYFIPKSEPLIMNYRSDPDEFVDVLTHELSHVLLTDNNVYQAREAKQKFSLIEKWQEMYGDLERHVLAHIPVHAMSKYIYVDILADDKRLMRDRKSSEGRKGGQAYVDAWEYVEKHDYRNILEGLRKMYEDIKNEG